MCGGGNKYDDILKYIEERVIHKQGVVSDTVMHNFDMPLESESD